MRVLPSSLKSAALRGSSRRWLVLLPVLLGLAAVPDMASPTSDAATPTRGMVEAVAARTLLLTLNSNLHLVGRPGRTLSEEGTFSGTLSGKVYSRYTAITSYTGTATAVMYPSSGGSISTRATTRGHVVGTDVDITGTSTATGGTGQWAHVSGSGLRFSGVVNRQNLRAASHLSGTIHF
jgi:hypothetical protein